MRNLKDLTKEELTNLMEKYLWEANTTENRKALISDVEKLLEGIHLEDDTTLIEIDKGEVSMVTNDGHRLTIKSTTNAS
jgi:hypothetical protein